MIPLGFIYKTTCIPTGKIYVGKHEFSLDKRRTSTYLGSGIILRKAVKKYGKESFKREILKICYSINQLNGYETYYIKKFKATDPEIGYNIALGGYGFRSGELNPCYQSGKKNPFYGHKHTQETKDKIASANRHPSKLKGRKMSIEARKKMSESAKLRMSNPENNPMFGKKHSEETKDKNRQWHLGKKPSEETRRRMREASKKVQHYWSTKRKVG